MARRRGNGRNGARNGGGANGAHAARAPGDSPPPIVLEDVWKSFGDASVLRGVDLTIPAGRTTVIAGQSGTGKSVLLKLMMGLVRPDRGRVWLFGKDATTLSEVELTALRRRMGMVFQNYALFDSLDVAENIGFFLTENTDEPGREIDRRVAELVAHFDLVGAERKVPSELSGGMKKRVSLARSLISTPGVLLVDEPTTGLDPIMTQRVTELLLETRADYDLTAVIISHDMSSATRLAHQLAILHEGRIVAAGPPDAVRASDHPTVRAFFENSIPTKLIETGAGVTAPARAAAAAVEPVVELRDVHRTFGTHHVLRGVDLTIAPKKITVIIGGSGSGKSVIIKHIMGLLRPDRGEVRLFGRDIARASERELAPVRARFGMLFQGAALLDSLTVEENVAFPLIERMGLPWKEARGRVADILAKVNIPSLGARYPAEISNGQRKRVGLARAMVTNPEVIIYDEPTTGQDPIMTRLVDDMIVEAQETFDVTSIVISHDMPSAFRIGHEIAMLHEGRMIVSAPPEEVARSTDERVRRFIYAGLPEPA